MEKLKLTPLYTQGLHHAEFGQFIIRLYEDFDKTSLDITWLKDKSLADLDNLPDPDVLATDIIENIEAGLDSFRAIIASLKN